MSVKRIPDAFFTKCLHLGSFTLGTQCFLNAFESFVRVKQDAKVGWVGKSKESTDADKRSSSLLFTRQALCGEGCKESENVHSALFNL